MNMDTSIMVIKGDRVTTYSSIERAAEALNLTARQLTIRATRESVIDGVRYQWTNAGTRRSYMGRKSRRKGHAFELEVIRRLRDAGYAGCVSSRSESRRTDDAKVDITDTRHELPCHIQVKNTRTIPNWWRIEQECPLKDKPFVIIHKTAGKEPLAFLPFRYFLDLIKKE